MAGEVLGWFLGLLLRVWPWMEVLTDVRQGQVHMVECLKAVCLMAKGSGEVAGGVCASMHVTHMIRRVVVESGEHYSWCMERQEDKLVEFRRMLYMVVEMALKISEEWWWRVVSTPAGSWRSRRTNLWSSEGCYNGG